MPLDNRPWWERLNEVIEKNAEAVKANKDEMEALQEANRKARIKANVTFFILGLLVILTIAIVLVLHLFG